MICHVLVRVFSKSYIHTHAQLHTVEGFCSLASWGVDQEWAGDLESTISFEGGSSSKVVGEPSGSIKSELFWNFPDHGSLIHKQVKLEALDIIQQV